MIIESVRLRGVFAPRLHGDLTMLNGLVAAHMTGCARPAQSSPHLVAIGIHSATLWLWLKSERLMITVSLR